MAKRGLGKGLGVLFGEDVAQEETPVVKRERKTTPKKTESNKKVEKYLKDDEYRAFFVEQVSKILQYLDKSSTVKLETMYDALQPYIDQDDWKLLLKQASKLKLLVVDKKKGIILRKEN